MLIKISQKYVDGADPDDKMWVDLNKMSTYPGVKP